MQFPKYPPTRLLLVEVAAATLLLSACGGGDAVDDTGPPLRETAADSRPTTDAASAETGSSAPASEVRASALAASCPLPAHATPKVGAFDMTRNTSESRRALLAKFDLAIVNLPYTASDGVRNGFAAGIKAINPDIRLAQYINFPDASTSSPTGEYDHALAQEVTARGWWLLDGAGRRTTWTGGATYGVNMTSWAPRNAAGQRYPQFKAGYDHTAYLAGVSGFDYVYTANTFAVPRVDADWRRSGTNQSRGDETIRSAMRAGYAAYWASLRARKPGIRVMAGLDNSGNLSSPEYDGKVDGAYLDGMIGANWSLEKVKGWSAMMAHYRSAIAHAGGEKLVSFSVYGASPTDYATLRYGLASALLDDGHFIFRPRSGSTVPAWYDEYDAPIGAPVDQPPVAPASNGVYLRRFENGLVLVNPGSASATIEVGSGYQRLEGTQDPAVNNGQVQSSVTLPARSGLVMLKVPGCDEARTQPESGYATPKIAAIDYSQDLSQANQANLARYGYVIVALSRNKGGSVMESFTSALKARNPRMLLAHYTLHNEVPCSVASNDDRYDLVQEVVKNDWWLRDAGGRRMQWTSDYGACDVNITAWGRRNAAGQTWAQYKWQRDWNAWYRHMPAVDYVHVDNLMWRYREDADFRRSRTDQPADDPTYAAAWRAGMMAYVQQVRASQPRLKISANADSDLSQPEYRGKIDFAFLEGVIGKSWSVENWGWDRAMDYYRGALRNVTTPGQAILQAFTGPTDYRLMRYGLASAMLEDGYFMQTNVPGTQKPTWYDEYGAPIGRPIEPPPASARQNGIWMRKYENGLVLVNPSRSTTASIQVGSGYRRIKGAQDPAVNHGLAQSTVTLPPRSGLLMLRN